MSKTRQKFLILAICLLPVCRGLAQPWYLPTDGADSVFLQNTSKQDQSVWLTGPGGSGEQSITVPAGQAMSVPLPAAGMQACAKIQAYDPVPLLVFAQKNSQAKFPVSPERADTLQLNSQQLLSSGLLVLSNLSALPQTLQIHLSVPLKPAQYRQINLAPYAEGSLNVPPFSSLEVVGNYGITGVLIGSSQVQELKPAVSKVHFAVDSKESYFLMSNPERNQSFVFHTHDASLIAQAQSQIQNPSSAKILIAKISQDHGNTNRDLLSPLKAVWSWQVSQALEFADLASQSCDGSPEIVEDQLSSWLDSGGAICFWSYKVLRQISPLELR